MERIQIVKDALDGEYDDFYDDYVDGKKELSEKTAILRCEPQKLDELLHPVFDKAALQKAKVITQGLPASPGAACGQIVFFADDAEQWHNDGHKVVMVRIETSPEDLAGMASAEGILTARGGMTSHAYPSMTTTTATTSPDTYCARQFSNDWQKTSST